MAKNWRVRALLKERNTNHPSASQNSFENVFSKKTSAAIIALYVVGAVVLLVASFSVTLALIDYWERLTPLSQPVVDVTKLPKLAPGQTLNFADGQNRNALLSGWSHPEPGGTWTSGHAAFLAFVITGTGSHSPTEVDVHANVFVGPPAVSRQRLQVWSASDKLADFDLKQSSADLVIPLEGLKFDDGTPLILGFYLPDAATPASAHMGGDTRLLALKVNSLQIK